MRNQLITLAQAQRTLMKNLASLAAIMAMFLSVSAQAGERVVTDSKTVAPAPPPPPELFGVGFYMGLDAGANVWQNNSSDRNFTNDAGDTLTLSPGSEVSFYGKIKANYVFGTEIFRPTFE